MDDATREESRELRNQYLIYGYAKHGNKHNETADFLHIEIMLTISLALIR